MAGLSREKLQVSTIVPAMNEAGNIDEFCRLYAEMLETAPFSGELVFIDDGSSDGTLEKIEAAADRYDFIRYAIHPCNRGLTAALQTGFEMASGNVFVFYPADLQYLPEDIPRMIEKITAGADVCTGWKQGNYKKKFVSTIYNWLSRAIFKVNVHDLNACWAFRREVIENIFLRRDWHRYLIALAAHEGYRVEEVKVTLYDRKYGETKFSVWRIPVGFLDMIAVKFQLSFLRKPLLFFGVTGSIFLAFGLTVGLWAVYLKYFLNETQLPLLYLVILLTGIGLGLFVMGFMLEGQTAIKEEVGDIRRKLIALDKKTGSSDDTNR
ncbi:MAG: glycosyltransferase family 2 protein [candidate division Zixibacteria bacterium]|nr:glycosyltransferase family 2 protein [candidate division Zixibacteria bacterium]